MTEPTREKAVIGATRIRIVDYDPSWAEKYEEHARMIRRALGDAALLVEHIGSTAVPGLAGKPKIDILLVVPDSRDESAYVSRLETAGYEFRLREPDWHEHRFLQTPDHGVNLHVVSEGSSEIDRWLLFRDWLRTNADARKKYEATKRRLAKRPWPSGDAYAEAKTDVIEGIIALATAERRGRWQRSPARETSM